jgi:hypothetical protein
MINFVGVLPVNLGDKALFSAETGLPVLLIPSAEDNSF